MNKLVLLALVLSLAGSAWGQCTPMVLQTTFASNNGQAGNMFDLVAINDVTVCSFDINCDPGTYTVEIWTLPAGSGWQTDPNNTGNTWTMAAQVSGVVSAGTDQPTPVPTQLNVTILAGVTQAFYVTLVGSTNINYTTGTMVGNVFASDTNLQFLEGAGKGGAFSGTFMPRVFNGNINYCTGLGATCPPPPAPPYQQNRTNASLDIDGVQSNGVSPAITTLCSGSVATFNIGGLAAAFSDIVIAVAPVLPIVYTTTGQQVVNIDLLNPTFQSLYGGLVPLAPAAVPVFVPPGTISAQMIVVDFTPPENFSLSQAVQLDGTTGSGTAPGPIGDDSFLEFSTIAAPLCGPGMIPFCGTMYSSVFVNSNGRLTFGASDTDFSPTIAEALADAPSLCGLWSDLNPSAGGSIDISTTATSFTATWNAVPYFGNAVDFNTFSLTIDTSGVCTIDVSGCLPNTSGGTGGGDAQFLGLSCGSAGPATDPGPVSFTVGGNGSNAVATDMIYDFWDGLAASAPGGINLNGSIQSLQVGSGILTFTPMPGGTYMWTGM